MLATDSIGAAATCVGELKALATSGTERSVLMPDMPTIAEAAVPGYATVQWHGLLKACGVMAAPIVDRLHRELKAIMGFRL